MFSIFKQLALATILCSTLVIGGPIEKRIVPISVCKSVASGTLKTTNGHIISLDSTGKAVFGGKGIAVQFQSCQPNFGHFDGKNGTATGGHIYVPSLKKCLTRPDASTIPFTLSAKACEYSDDSSQTFSNFALQSDKKIYHVASTFADGTYVWHGDVCESGYYGVKSSQTSGTVSFHCVNDGHIIGLNI